MDMSAGGGGDHGRFRDTKVPLPPPRYRFTSEHTSRVITMTAPSVGDLDVKPNLAALIDYTVPVPLSRWGLQVSKPTFQSNYAIPPPRPIPASADAAAPSYPPHQPACTIAVKAEAVAAPTQASHLHLAMRTPSHQPSTSRTSSVFSISTAPAALVPALDSTFHPIKPEPSTTSMLRPAGLNNKRALQLDHDDTVHQQPRRRLSIADDDNRMYSRSSRIPVGAHDMIIRVLFSGPLRGASNGSCVVPSCTHAPSSPLLVEWPFLDVQDHVDHLQSCLLHPDGLNMHEGSPRGVQLACQVATPATVHALRLCPNVKVVHFFGHGSAQEGLYLEGDDFTATPLPWPDLAAVFQQANACRPIIVLSAHSNDGLGSTVADVCGVSYVVWVDLSHHSAHKDFLTHFYTQLVGGATVQASFLHAKTRVPLTACELYCSQQPRVFIKEELHHARDSVMYPPTGDDRSSSASNRHVACPALASFTGFPRFTHRFCERSHEVGHIGAYILHPSVRLVVISGPPGMGKTSLVTAVAQHLHVRAKVHALVYISTIHDHGMSLVQMIERAASQQHTRRLASPVSLSSSPSYDIPSVLCS
ncbi:hypothetical protein, variant 1 [Aphanomyces astaci]|uniref:ATPase AAA-type core domain-containing protein n=1 Tax=Aphanomyces astaci TaxID=112090 RepID=W4GUE0_APHAT|nr:hypothetical protein, variant 1 [Aphanomyces astaci]ETV83355.1 hypothetical protein, variant 1 [Aphanomyces astaci]|eukprot:XP_009826786.1 hypothetical protein, variant 1 [Aphanomyces astaci]